LLVEDDEMLGGGLQSGLMQDGYAVDWVKDGDAAELFLRTEEYEIVILDLGLPKKSGIDVLRHLRSEGGDIPVLILTARDFRRGPRQGPGLRRGRLYGQTL